MCGVDGKTYGNKCEAACTNVDIAYEGECKVEPVCSCADPAFDARVCGTDGVTYGSSCLAQCAGYEVQSDGPCPEVACRCQNIDEPVRLCLHPFSWCKHA